MDHSRPGFLRGFTGPAVLKNINRRAMNFFYLRDFHPLWSKLSSLIQLEVILLSLPHPFQVMNINILQPPIDMWTWILLSLLPESNKDAVYEVLAFPFSLATTKRINA